MNVAGIFKILIIVVACVIIGGILLNVLLPNGLNSMINWVENGVYSATGATFDLNGDGGHDLPAAEQLDADDGSQGAGVGGYGDFKD